MAESLQFATIDACVGLHGSASTWVFNVVRELKIGAAGEANVLSLYADDVGAIAVPDGRHLVLKSHHGSAELEAWLEANRASLILSVRDPRDATISLAQRFKVPLEKTAAWIANDCRRLSRLLPRAKILLRYEQRFFDLPETVSRLSELLQSTPPLDVLDAIFQRYRTDAVKAFAANLDRLPAGRVVMGPGFLMDSVTQIHAPHIGDAASGKWRLLPGRIRAPLSRFFAPFLNEFGYELE